MTDKILEYVEYEPTSPSSIVWKNNRAGMRNEHAGSLVPNKKGPRFRVCIEGNHYQVSRVVYFMHNIDMDQNKEVDHIDRNPLNNNIENLRLVSRSENSCNRGISKNNTTGYKQITVDIDNRNGRGRKRYCVSIEKDHIRYRRIFDYSNQGLLDAITYRDFIVASKHGEFAPIDSEFTGTRTHSTKSPVEK